MLVFLFSFDQVGGVPVLYFNLAKELNHHHIPFKLICNCESEIYKLFDSANLDYYFIDYQTLSKKNIVGIVQNEDVLLITWWDPKLPLFKNVNPRFLFWNVYPDTLYRSNAVRDNLILHKRNEKLILYLLANHGLLLMDDSPLTWLKKYRKINLDNIMFLPIPVEIHSNDYLKRTKSAGQINIAYTGRTEKWKLYPLLKIIGDIEGSRHKDEIILHIATDDILKLQESLAKEGFRLRDNNHYKLYENLSLFRLEELIKNNIDLTIGMGTTCLDSGKFGIPTLLINPSHERINAVNAYKWLFYVKNYNLGAFSNIEPADYTTLECVLDQAFNDKDGLDQISSRVFNYVESYHNIKNITLDFNRFINGSNCRVLAIVNKVFLYSLIYKIKRKVKFISAN